MLGFLYNYKNLGLLLLRFGIGLSFAVGHGYEKLLGKEDPIASWTKLGGNMSYLGLDFWPAFWGFMAAFAEFGGGIFIALGLCFRSSSAFLAFTMFIAFLSHTVKYADKIAKGDTVFTIPLYWREMSHSLELMILFVCLILIGPGKYSLDHFIFKKSPIEIK